MSTMFNNIEHTEERIKALKAQIKLAKLRGYTDHESKARLKAAQKTLRLLKATEAAL